MNMQNQKQADQTIQASHSPLILPLSASDASLLPLVGGKAANLGELIRAGLPVPDGLCITTAAHELALWALARQVQADRQLSQLARETPPAQLAEDYRKGAYHPGCSEASRTSWRPMVIAAWTKSTWACRAGRRTRPMCSVSSKASCSFEMQPRHRMHSTGVPSRKPRRWLLSWCAAASPLPPPFHGEGAGG